MTRVHARTLPQRAACSVGFSVTVNLALACKSTIGRCLTGLHAMVLPPICCMCDGAGSRDLRRSPFDLCPICAELLPINARPCPRCALPVPDPDRLCAGCASDPPAFDCALVPYLYSYPVEHLVRALKFHGERIYARLLGQLLAAACVQRSGPRPDVLVPVPLHAARYRQRGFNQAHEIARSTARTLGLPFEPDALVRVTATREQSGLPLVDRRRNVRGAFEVWRLPKAGRIALVDDVLTTGSTAAEAARVLKAAGVAHVEIWAVARVGRGNG